MPEIVLTDAPVVPTEAENALGEAMSAAERRWIARQMKRQARALGTSKYIRHQGTRERARRVSRMETV